MTNKISLNTDDHVTISNGILNLELSANNPTYTYVDENGVPQTITRKYSQGMIHSRNTEEGGWSIAKMGCYKFAKFTTRMRFPKSKKVNASFWFFGAGNEIDVFELFDGTNGHVRSSIHQWNIIAPDGVTHAEYALNYELGKLAEKFHIWELNWTPYKITWSLDGKIFRTFYRYYQLQVTENNHDKRACLVGLECADIPQGETEIWELNGWYSFATRPIDVTMGMGILDTPNGDEKVEIDWIKIEQRPNMQITVSDETPCVGEPITIMASVTDQIAEWKVSDNLEIISIDENILTVVGNQDGTLGWVEATVIGNNIELPEGNWNKLGYSTNDEFDKNSIPFHNFSYNCHDTPIKIKKEILIGKPAAPILENNIRPCLLSGGFDIWVNQNQVLAPNTIYNWSAISDATILEKDSSVWITPSLSLENDFFKYQLEMTNDCGSSTFDEEVFFPKCKNNSDFPVLIIYPNPVQDLLHFQLKKTNYEIIEPSDSPFLIVKSETGEVVLRGELGEVLHAIDIASWAQGNYKISYQINGMLFSEGFS
ncbi:MAG TPA: glycosyl hydrolase family protein, partial [Phaeodactylibacter sp.]|nr:glycosyl hydrolase family protein [Phaeodactylibacter sp.]